MGRRERRVVIVAGTGTLRFMPLVEVNVEGIGYDQAQKIVLVLSDASRKRCVPLWIGNAEANVIHNYLYPQENIPSFTHDIFAVLFAQTGMQLMRVVIGHAADEVTSAALHLQQSEKPFQVESRPSDAVALALRLKAPVFVEEFLLQGMEIPITQTTPESPPPIASPIPEDTGPVRDKVRRFFGR